MILNFESHVNKQFLKLYNLKTKIYSSEEKRNAYFTKFGKKGNYDLNASAVLDINNQLEKVYQRILIRHIAPQQ